LNDFDSSTQAIASAPLVAHLSGHFFLLGDLAHHARFINRVSERLLAIDVFAHSHGHDTGRCVDVVRGADHDGVDLFSHLLEHLPVVFK
jgi:hypothetical protein